MAAESNVISLEGLIYFLPEQGLGVRQDGHVRVRAMCYRVRDVCGRKALRGVTQLAHAHCRPRVGPRPNRVSSGDRIPHLEVWQCQGKQLGSVKVNNRAGSR